MVLYKEVTQQLVNMGLVDVILPFILVFVVVYGIATRTQALGKQKNIAGMLAFVLGFLAVLATNVVKGIGIVVSTLVLLPVIGLAVALVIGLIGGKLESKFYKIVMTIVFFALAGVGIRRASFIDPRFADTLLWPLFILGALIGGFIYLFAPKKKTEEEKKKDKKETGVVLQHDKTIKPEGTQEI